MVRQYRFEGVDTIPGGINSASGLLESVVSGHIP
ncbi:hypothetical protein DFR76_11527 [Nocardia pseudobrasiliensis]|uniref:Uncharacterized protein n=1 Tax=Nocardia pseudobrasiliensis TaxID=45979 RepID=A0A370HPD5_9NOCA|nr:hypothetical protein DFR76_11527 [Nocardia pseudobrasiliensis]